MGRMLQIGVTVAALVVLAGGILYLLQSGGSKPDYAHFQGAPAAVSTVSGIVSGAMHMDARERDRIRDSAADCDADLQGDLRGGWVCDAAGPVLYGGECGGAGDFAV